MSIFSLRQLLVAICFFCYSGVILTAQAHYMKHYSNPVSESDAYIKYSFNFTLNATPDNSYKTISAGLKTRSGKTYLELCFLKDDGSGRTTNPMREVEFADGSGTDGKVIQIISNSQGNYVFVRWAKIDPNSLNLYEKLTYLHFNPAGDLLSKHELKWNDAANGGLKGLIRINQIIQIPNNSIAMVGSIENSLPGGFERILFAIVNLNTHLITTVRQYSIDADLMNEDNPDDEMDGLSILRFGTSGYFLGGALVDDIGGRPFLMRVDASGGLMWVRNFPDPNGDILGKVYYDKPKALSSFRLFATNDGSGGTYYGFIYGSLDHWLRLIRFDPNANITSTSGLVDYHIITGFPFDFQGETFLSEINPVGSLPSITGTIVTRINQAGDQGSYFFSYNLLTNTGQLYDIYNGVTPTTGIKHGFTRNIIEGTLSTPGPKAPLYIGSETRDVSSTTKLRHLMVKTEPIGTNPFVAFACHNPQILTSEDISTPIEFNFGQNLGLFTFALSLTNEIITATTNIGFGSGDYCTNIVNPFNGKSTEREQDEKSDLDSDQNSDLAYVRIYNITGQLILERENVTISECQELLIDRPTGVYLLEREFASGKRSIEKVFHSNQ